MHTSYSVPFVIDGINHGFQEAKGLIKLNEEGLEFEFEVEDTLIGAFKSGIKTVCIPYQNLETVEFKKGLISSKIVIEGTSMQALNDLPGAEVASCKLKVKRKDKQEAARLVSKARVGLSEFRLDQMEN